MATTQCCKTLSLAARALLLASQQQPRDAGWVVLGALPDVAVALRRVEQPPVEDSGTPMDREVASMQRLGSLAVCLSHCACALHLTCAAPEVGSPSQTRVWCLAGAPAPPASCALA